VDQPESPRGVRWIASQPYASLLVCIACIALQIVTGFLLMLITLESGGNEAAGVVMKGVAVVMFLLPLGSVYGIYLARPSSGYGREGGWLRGLGLLANILYLMMAIFVAYALLSRLHA
jgi:hypothetical protein